MSQQKINRRKFLEMSAAGVAGLVIASCAPAATQAPAEPTAAPQQPAVQASPTPIPAQSASATPVPTLVEAKYKEAPALADRVGDEFNEAVLVEVRSMDELFPGQIVCQDIGSCLLRISLG